MFSTAEKTIKPAATLQRKGEGTSFFGKAHATEAPASATPFFAPAIQLKLSVSTPGDRFETEADATAERVMGMPDSVAIAATPPASPRIDRQAAKEEKETILPKADPLTISQMPDEQRDEEKAVQTKRNSVIQRFEESDGYDYDAGPDTFVQAFTNRTTLALHRSDVVQQSGRGSPPVSDTFEQSLQTNAGGGNPLPDQTRSFMETRFGADFSGVRVHTDASAQEMSRDIHAHAFTHGNHIYFNSGQFDPDSSGGRTLLAHELTHTIQQGAAPVAPTVSPKHQFTAVQSKAIQRQGAVPQLDQAVALAKGEEGNVNANATGPEGNRQIQARTLKELRKDKFRVQRKEADQLQRAEEPQTEEEPEEIQRADNSEVSQFADGAGTDEENSDLQRQAASQTLIVQARAELAGRISSTPAGLQMVQASWLGDAWDAVSGLAGEIADLVEQGLDAAKNWLLEKVRDFVMEIPGYKLLRFILQYDPITGESVPRTAMTLLEAVLDIIPVGGAIVRSVLDYFQATEPVANWLMSAVDRFIGLIESVGSRFEQFWNSLSIDDVGDPDGVIERIASLFRGIVSDIVNFVSECATTFLTMVKDIAITNVVQFVRNYFPTAFDLLCVILNENPITGETVPRTGANILNAGLNVLGERGQQIRGQMMENGIFQRCAAWIDRGISVVTEAVRGIEQGFVTLWNSLSFESLFHPIDTFNTIVDAFRQPVTLITDFIGDAVRELLKLLKEVLLDRLSAFARDMRGYFLITVILGRDPFTGKDVERNAENLIHGFMSLMEGGEAQFQQMKESGAIDRTTQKINAAIKRLNFTWAYVVGLFTSLWESMDWTDFLNPLAAFGRIIGTFAQPVRRLIAFIVEIIKIVVEVLLIVMSFPIDIVTSIINKIIALFDTIKRDPIGFLKNLLRAIKQGFIQFFDNILTHLLNGLADWFFFQLRELGIERPTDLSFRSILKLVMEVLGISLNRIMDKVWKKLEEKIGKEKVAKIKLWIDRLEGIWKFIKDVMERGPIAIWEYIQEQLSNLWSMVIDAAKNWIMEKVVNAVIAKLLSMLDPTGIMAVINSVLAIYRAIQSVIAYIRQLLEIINSFVDGVTEIASGNIKVAADFLERSAARGVPVMIGFLANQVGLGKIADKLVEIIGTLREKVDMAVDWLVDKAVSIGMPLINGILNLIERGEGLVERGRQAVSEWIGDLLGIRKTFTAQNGESHSLYLQENGDNAELMLASTPVRFRDYFASLQVNGDPAKETAKQTAIPVARQIDRLLAQLRRVTGPERATLRTQLNTELTSLSVQVAILFAGQNAPAGTRAEPIEMYWYKPRASYPQTVTLEDNRRGLVTIPFGSVRRVFLPDADILTQSGRQSGIRQMPALRRRSESGGFDIGVRYIPEIESILQKNRSYRAILRTEPQRSFRALMEVLGRDMSTTSEDADHVVDLQFSGIDDFMNLWPLNADVNRSALRFGEQPVTVKLNNQIVVLPLNSDQLIGKFFKIKGFQLY